MLVTGCGLKDKLKTHCEIFMDTLFFYYSESKMGSGARTNYKNALLLHSKRKLQSTRVFSNWSLGCEHELVGLKSPLILPINNFPKLLLNIPVLISSR